MIDVKEHISAVRREVGTRTLEEARVVTIMRTYDAPVDDVWDACTDIERIPRWFAPVTGDLRVGGRYQVQGNAGGLVERCDPPRSFAATWEFGGQVSGIEVRLDPAEDGTLRPWSTSGTSTTSSWGQFGPGAVGVGGSWGCSGWPATWAHPGVPTPPDGEAWAVSDEGREFVTLSAEAWGEAHASAARIRRRRGSRRPGRRPSSPGRSGCGGAEGRRVSRR